MKMCSKCKVLSNKLQDIENIIDWLNNNDGLNYNDLIDKVNEIERIVKEGKLDD